MATEPTPETHAMVPVLEPTTGDIHAIAVPFGTDSAGLHAALADYYVDSMPENQPTEGGALENQDSFRQAARSAIARSQGSGAEEGFVVNSSGVPTAANRGQRHDVELTVHPGDSATFHVHPTNPVPSHNDIALSKQTKIPFYITSKDGLYMVRPSDGAVLKVFDKRNWADKNYNKEKTI